MFANRRDAGRRLGAALASLRDDDVVVLGLPRGGVPVAAEVAAALDAPLDVVLVRKLGLPSQPELAMGAIGEDGVMVVHDEVTRIARVAPEVLERVAERERVELERRARAYRGAGPAMAVSGRTVIVVDDGIATGSTARAACAVVRGRGAARVILAVPVAPPGLAGSFVGVADEVVIVEEPPWLHAVGQAYDDFSATTDAEVVELLEGDAIG